MNALPHILVRLPNRVGVYRCLITAGECWEWPSVYSDGYGRVKIGGRSTVAHRAVYELLREPVAADRELDHLCRNRRCVNPAHLEPVTGRENQLRGNTFTRAHAERVECTRGHPLTAMRRFPCGKSRCQACELERQRKVRATPEYRAKHAAQERQRKSKRKELLCKNLTV